MFTRVVIELVADHYPSVHGLYPCFEYGIGSEGARVSGDEWNCPSISEPGRLVNTKKIKIVCG